MKKILSVMLVLFAATQVPAMAQARGESKAKIGGPLYDVELHDVEWNMSNLTDYVGIDGKYLLVNFWTANCPKCHEGFLEVKKYYDLYAPKLTVIGVMVSDNHEGWLEMYAHKQPFAWPNLSDGKKLAEGAGEDYGIRLYPTYVLVTPGGEIVRMWSGFEKTKFREQLAEYFAAPVQ